jgi:outer membrane protein assembly factor BamA
MNLPVFKKVAQTALFSVLLCSSVSGQSKKAEIQDTTVLKQKDIVDLLQQGLKIRLRKDTISEKGKGPFVAIMPALGYALQSGLTGTISTNTLFYTDESRNRYSNVLFNSFYSEYHQYWFIANNNLFFEKYKLHIFGDTRYYNYPTQTFGLGTNSSLSDELDIKYSYLRFCQIIYRELRPNIFAGIGYNLDDHWNIKTDNILGKALDDFEKYQKGTRAISSGVSLNFLFDNRKNAVNPAGGSYASLQYRPNLTLLGSDSNWQSLLIDLRTYVKFPVSTRNILAFWNYNNFTLNGTPPYLDTPSVGWDAYSNTGRGYVPGRYVGKNFMYFESEYRFALTRNGLLGGVVFGNSETVFQKWSESHTIIPAGGLGIRIKMNKFSNTNLAIDYGFGVGGSRGLFFNLGEIF